MMSNNKESALPILDLLLSAGFEVRFRRGSFDSLSIRVFREGKEVSNLAATSFRGGAPSLQEGLQNIARSLLSPEAKPIVGSDGSLVGGETK